ncbi:MAG: hypothetical protein AAF871_06865 [Pseudomonadota bacterium]
MKLFLSITALILGLGACAQIFPTDVASERFLSLASANVASVAADEGIPVDQDATVSAARSDGGVAVFAPEAGPSGGFVGWLELPETHACASTLPAANYTVSAEIGARSALVSWRQIGGAAKLDAISVPVSRISDTAPVMPMARVALGPDSFLLGRWFTCSTGSGHCGYALTLDGSTPGCGG